MKKVWRLLLGFVKEHFEWKLYAVFAFLTLLFIVFNYAVDFEDSFVDNQKPFARFLWFFLLHACGYFAVLFAEAKIKKRPFFSLGRSFWIVSLAGFAVLAFDRSINFNGGFLRAVDPAIYQFVYKLSNQAISGITFLTPLAAAYFLYFKKRLRGFYGVVTKEANFRPYVMMLAIMIPLIWLASLTKDFADQYPVYKRSGGADFAAFFGVSEWFSIFAYEFLYLADFVVVELFFRGFLIIALAYFLGPAAILPMATTYAILHFGKPAGETVSSVFGGYILGVLAYKTGNIWGGIFIHMGVAFLMEVFAFI